MAITKGEPKGKHNFKYNMNTLISAATNRPVKHGEGIIKPHMYWCEVCKVKLTHPMSAIEHFSSKIHFSKVDTEKPREKRKQDNSVSEPPAKVSKWGPPNSKQSSVSSKDKNSKRGGSDKKVGAIGSSDVSIGRDKLSNSVGDNRDGFNDKGNRGKEIFLPVDVSRGPGILNPFVAVLNNQGIIPNISSNDTVGLDNNPGFGNIGCGFSNPASFTNNGGGLNNPQGFVNPGIGLSNNLQGFGNGVSLNNPGNFGNNDGGIMNTPVSFGIAGIGVNNPGTSVNKTNFNNIGGLNNQGGGVSGGSVNPGTSVNNTNFDNMGGLNNRGGGVSVGRGTGVSPDTSVNPGTSVNKTNFNNRGGLNNQVGGVSGGRGFGVSHGASVNPATSVNNTNFNNRGGLNNRGGGVRGGMGTGVSRGASVRGGFNSGRGGHGYKNKNVDLGGNVISHGGFTLSREVKGVSNQGPSNVGPYQPNQQWNNSSTLQPNSFGSGQGNVYQGNNPAPYNNAPILPTPSANVFGNVVNQMGGNFRK